MAHKYKLTYDITRHPEGLDGEEIKAKNLSGCDAILLASIIYPEDGSLSILFVGQDGRTDTELTDNEWFKVWSMLSKRLAESETLESGKKMVADASWDLVKQVVFGERRPLDKNGDRAGRPRKGRRR